MDIIKCDELLKNYNRLTEKVKDQVLLNDIIEQEENLLDTINFIKQSIDKFSDVQYTKLYRVINGLSNIIRGLDEINDIDVYLTWFYDTPMTLEEKVEMIINQ